MSKYALPGMFNLPEILVDHPISIGLKNVQLESKCAHNEDKTSQLRKWDNIETRPRYTTSHFGRYVQKNESPFVEHSMEEKLEYCGKEPTIDFRSDTTQPCKFDIIVDKVMIDWVQYVKSSNDGTNNENSTNRGCLPNRSDRVLVRHPKLGLADDSCTRISRRRQRVNSFNEGCSTQDEKDNNEMMMSALFPLENAIKFDLKILRNGQSYNVVRSLQQIRQLHGELVHISTLYSEDKLKVCSTTDGEDQQRHTSCNKNETKAMFSIPAIPELLNSMYTFSNLQSLYGQMIQSYAPTIETWFRTVFDSIPSKLQTSVSYFFYEPIITVVSHCNTVATSSRFPSLIPRRRQQQQNRRQHRRRNPRQRLNNGVVFNLLEIIQEDNLEIEGQCDDAIS